MNVATMTIKLLIAEMTALQDIEQAGPLSAADRAYYQAIVTEIKTRLQKEAAGVK